MKRVLVLLIVLGLMFTSVGFAADISTTWGWGDTNAIGTVGSWDIFRSPSATGPWTLIKNQVFYDKGAAVEYITTSPVTVADNAVTVVYFKSQTVGTNGLRSTDSNIINVSYDTRAAPAAPLNFKVK